MTDEHDDAIVVDLTHPYEADWMARGRKQNKYTEAFRDRLQQEYGLSREQAEGIGLQYFSDRFRIHEREWDVIWDDDREPAEAVEQYLGEARVELAALEQQDATDGELYEDVKQQAEREQIRLEASRDLERFLKQEGYDDIEISGIGPWHDGSPYELDEDDWAAVEEGADPVDVLGEDYVLAVAERYTDAQDTY